ncbi:glycosyltransferase [Sphingomonas sp. Leaf34]|uniref:glycosyltransferase n=1 Tax=Sphingomonas sp. Leaf34 TaxID=1736216 RepID=UPI00138F7171|nr:glycosyltransferase [Sphingomonas sp. Leaf34]
MPIDQVLALMEDLLAAAAPSEDRLASLCERLFNDKRDVELAALGQVAWPTLQANGRALVFLGRSLLRAGRAEQALAALERLQQIMPGRYEVDYYLGIALLRLQRAADAYSLFSALAEARPQEHRYRLEAGRAAQLVAFGGYGAMPPDRDVLPEALEHLQAANALAPKDFRAPRELAGLLMHLGDTSGALEAAEAAAARAPGSAAAQLTLAGTALRIGRLELAAQAADRAVAAAPENDTAKFTVRFLSHLGQSKHGHAGVAHLADAAEMDVADISRCLQQVDADWMRFGSMQPNSASDLAEKRGFEWAGGIVTSAGAVHHEWLWRRVFLLELIDAGLTPSDGGLRALLALAHKHGAIVEPEDGPGQRDGVGGRVLLISQFGARKFGGAEHFLEQMARLYRDLGYEPLIVGTREELEGETGDVNGIPYVYVGSGPESLLRLAVREEATITHVVSGLGYEVLTGLRFLRGRLIFGVHFWREIFYHPTPSPGYYPDVGIGAEPRPEFNSILRRFDTTYVNSKFTRDTLESSFDLRAPVIYSLPDDEPITEIDPASRDEVLLVNARSDKGFDLLLRVAERLPGRNFVTIATQTERRFAEEAITAMGLDNITVLERTSDMAALYKRARVVMVPSYHFVETFSRVVIEAQRHGTPVIGSDRGNVPLLLAESGTVLQEDPALWAAQIERLFTDEPYWQDQSVAAYENSARYAFAQQRERLSQIVLPIQQPILVGVGSGLGNIIHTTPMLRNLAKRWGRPVDVVVAGDHGDLLFVVSLSGIVNQAFLIGDNVLERRYDTVFLTHSFGAMTPRFSARRTLCSRDWDVFHPNHALHEAEFNLAAADALLGVPYDIDDVRAPYCGDLRWTVPKDRLVGFHAGSKDGVWATKRWPWFAELARQLTSRGIPVASFGTPDEAIPGTIDMTGGNIEQMATRMLNCSQFVANDSGVMNIANSLNIPLIALFGPTNARTRGPLGEASAALVIDKPCAPCELHTSLRTERFLAGQCRCMSEMSVETVLHALLNQSAG